MGLGGFLGFREEGQYWMKKLQICILIVVALFTVTGVSISVALAQENETDGSNANRFVVKLAEILGQDEVVVEDAIKQTRRELRDETVQNKLNAMVAKGILSQAQSDEYLDWIRSRPEGVPAIGRHGFGRKGNKQDWKRHRRPFGKWAHSYGKVGKVNLGDVEKELNVMVENGKMTMEEAEEKLKWYRGRIERLD